MNTSRANPSPAGHRPFAPHCRHSALPLALAAVIVGLAAAPGTAAAQVASTQLPAGGSIVGGTGTINAASGNTLTIDQTSSRMALDWSTFDIGSAATVTFNQPSTSAVVLNRVQGGNPTQIFGNLNANGQVFLVNTNGMIFGSTAQINVGGLVASTLGISASDFMSGNDVLDAGGNTVALMSNSGTINAAAGAVDLIGGKVVNSGTITASAGNINLIAADKVTLTFESGGFGVVVDKALQLQLDTLAVDNSGTLSAPGGTITLQARAAQGMFDQLINNSGVISAAAISSGSDGSVSLVANGAGQTGIGGGGSIDVGSGTISISTDRGVQQSGAYTAGTLSGSIGGNASFTGNNHIATLGSLGVSGNLSLSNATDLTQSGALTVGGTSTFALGGHALTLDNAGNDFGQAVSLTSGSATITDSGALTLGTLATGNLTAISSGALNLGSGTVTGTLAATSNGGAISQSASNPLTVTGSSTLDAGTGAITLQQAANDFGGAVSLTGSGIALIDANALTIAALTLGSDSALSLTAGGTLILPTSAINTGSANLSLHSGNVLATAAALSGTNVNLSGDAGITLAHDVSATGTLALTASNSAIVQSAGALAVSGIGNVNAGSGAITLSGAGNNFGQAVSLTGGTTAITDSGALTLGTLATGNLNATSNGALNLGGGTVAGTLDASSNGGAITQGNALAVTGVVDVDAGTGSITLENAGNDFGSSVALSGGNVRIVDINALTLNASSANSLRASSGGTLTLTDTIQANTIELATSGTFINNAGADALDITGSGQWRVYLTDLTAPHQYGELDSQNTAVWGTAAFGDVTASGNRYVFSYQPTLLFTSTDQSKIYGQIADLSQAFSTSGLMQGVAGAYLDDTLATAVTGAAAIDSAGAAATAQVAGGPYAINISAGSLNTSASGYALAFANDGLLSIGRAALTITANDAGKTYGQTASLTGYSADGLLNSDAVTDVALNSNGSVATANVGNYQITADNAVGTGLSNYDITYVDGTLSIGKAGLTITAHDAGKTYGQTVSLTGYTVDGLLNSDAVTDVALNSNGSVATANVGNYQITADNADGAGLSNYDITYVDGTLTIGKAGLTITAHDAGKTYGQTVSLTGYTVEGLLNSDAVASVDLNSNGSVATANVGNYQITADNADGAGLSNYDITYVDGTLTIGKAGLTITAHDAGKTYGQTASLTGYTVNGLLNSDAVTDVALNSNGSVATANVGNYLITAVNADGTGLSNYDITYVDGTLSIGKAGLTITASDAGKTYGQTTSLTGYTVDGLLNSDAVTDVDLSSNGSVATANVGNYQITADNADGTGLSNYDITYVDGTLSIGKAGLTITAQDVIKPLGTSVDLDGAYDVQGLLNSDTVSAVDVTSEGASPEAPNGLYAIEVGNARGEGLSNYDINYVEGSLSIGSVELTNGQVIAQTVRAAAGSGTPGSLGSANPSGTLYEVAGTGILLPVQCTAAEFGPTECIRKSSR